MEIIMCQFNTCIMNVFYRYTSFLYKMFYENNAKIVYALHSVAIEKFKTYLLLCCILTCLLHLVNTKYHTENTMNCHR